MCAGQLVDAGTVSQCVPWLQERFRSLVSGYIRDAAAAIVWPGILALLVCTEELHSYRLTDSQMPFLCST